MRTAHNPARERLWGRATPRSPGVGLDVETGEAATADLLRRCKQGDARAYDTLFAAIYEDLRRRARFLPRVAGGTLSTTALVHETYLKLAGAGLNLNDRAHFFALAARAMRQVLVDHARNRGRQKRGGDLAPVTLDLNQADPGGDLFEVLALDAALARLSELDESMGQIVEWHVFGGIGLDDVAELLGVNVRTVFRRWRAARAFLVKQLGMTGEQDDGRRTLAADHGDL